jgi:hypothetical protein
LKIPWVFRLQFNWEASVWQYGEDSAFCVDNWPHGPLERDGPDSFSIGQPFDEPTGSVVSLDELNGFEELSVAHFRAAFLGPSSGVNGDELHGVSFFAAQANSQ